MPVQALKILSRKNDPLAPCALMVLSRKRACAKMRRAEKIVRDDKFTRQFIDIRQTCASPTKKPAGAN